MARQHSPIDDLRDIRAVLASNLSTPERIVMVSLISHRNGGSGRCDPSVSRLALETGLGRRTVVRAVASLEGRDFLVREQRAGIRTRYRITIPTSATAAPVPGGHQCQAGTGPVPERHGTGATVAPERTKNERRERTSPAFELWPIYVEEMDGARLTLTATRRRRLDTLHAEQLAGESDPLESFRKILRAVKASPHHMGNRDYHMPESLFRDQDRRERWAEKARTNGSHDSAGDFVSRHALGDV